MNWQRAFIPVLFILPLIYLLATRFGTDPRAVPSVLVGNAAPTFDLADVNGRRMASQQLRGKPAVNRWQPIAGVRRAPGCCYCYCHSQRSRFGGAGWCA